MSKTRPMAVVAELRPALRAEDRPSFTLTERELEDLVERASLRALSAFKAGEPRTPALLGGAEMAQQLGVSRTKMHRLREQGCPCVRVGDVFKFQPEKVLAWLEEHSRDAG
jgi:hypothetical protein